jgi:hypothetical protein
MNQAADLPLEHVPTPPTLPSVRSSRFFIVTTIALGLVLWLAAIFQTLFILPRFEKLFLEFAIRMPLPTEAVMRNAWRVVPACVVLAVAIPIAIRRRWAWLFALIRLPILVNLFLFLAYYLPYATLVGGLGGQNPLGW